MKEPTVQEVASIITRVMHLATYRATGIPRESHIKMSRAMSVLTYTDANNKPPNKP